MDRMVTLAHKFLAEVVSCGDLALDLTAGGGRDTLFLAQRTGAAGRVFAFDIQKEALDRTRSLLEEQGLRASLLAERGFPRAESGIFLVKDGHERVGSYVRERVKGAIANLGYLPSGDRSIATRTETTLQALAETLPLLAPGGRLAVIAYVAHPGGRKESEAVSALFRDLPSDGWRTMKTEMMNRDASPFLLMAERV
jgi:16S rRNA C1402 N4-methylase RsmH